MNGALLQCTFGAAPSVLVVLPASKLFCSQVPAATIQDYKPLVNILPFGMCRNLQNPMVMAATAAAYGVLTPMPCIPVVVSPWTPGNPTLLLGGSPALTSSSKAQCVYGGVISISMTGQFTVQY